MKVSDGSAVRYNSWRQTSGQCNIPMEDKDFLTEGILSDNASVKVVGVGVDVGTVRVVVF